MTTAIREALCVAPDTHLVVVVSDDGETRLELLRDHGSGNEPEVIHCLPIPADALADVAELLAFASRSWGAP